MLNVELSQQSMKAYKKLLENRKNNSKSKLNIFYNAYIQKVFNKLKGFSV